jgi:hypothetical protein
VGFTKRADLHVAGPMTVEEQQVCNSIVALRNGAALFTNNWKAAHNQKNGESPFELLHRKWRKQIGGCTKMQNRRFQFRSNMLDNL